MTTPDIPGYSYGTEAAAKSPVTLVELAKLEQVWGLPTKTGAPCDWPATCLKTRPRPS
jgi:hypothetical protein